VFDFLARIFAVPLTFFYEITNDYLISILLITVLVMAVTTPLTLKSTKGMLEMQKLQPEIRRLQQQHRGDRQALNQEMMRLYQEHKVNPLASCLPLLLQMPVFIGMFTLLRGLTMNVDPVSGYFQPKFVKESSQLYQDLSASSEMVSFGLNLAKSPVQMVQDDPPMGLLYVGFVVVLGVLYWFQQRMIANRASTPTMSPVQAKIMQYLPVAFAPINLFFQLGLVIYYIAQAVLRIGQQGYITRRFYRGESSLGRQAQAASRQAREISKADKADTSTARPARSSRPAPSTKGGAPTKAAPSKAGSNRGVASKAVTPPKGRPTPSGRAPKPATTGGRPATPAKPRKPVKPTRPTKPGGAQPPAS
jgi:YidC/Oxa1 family membrane protein insertase